MPLHQLLRSLAIASLALPCSCGCPAPQETRYDTDPTRAPAFPPKVGVALPEERCQTECPPPESSGGSLECVVETVQSPTRATILCRWVCEGAGRRPAGVTTFDRASGDGRGDRAGEGRYFAEVAAYEEASVAAFVQLARELRHHGAPARLAAEATRAAGDERRHRSVMSALARRLGAQPARARVALPPRPRPLLELAADNEREGCVGEAYGAAVLYYQSAASSEPVVRRALASVARDEVRHAALSLAVSRWARARVGREASRELLAARRAALDALRADAGARAPASVAGLPCAARARALVDAVGAHLRA